MDILLEERREPLALSDPSQNNSRRSYPGGLVMSPAEIEAFVGTLTIRQARIVQYLFRMLDSAMSDAERPGGLTHSDLCVVRELATAYDCESYLAFMRRLVAGVDEGREGCVAAYCTLRQAIDLIHKFPADRAVMEKINDAWTRVALSVTPQS